MAKKTEKKTLVLIPYKRSTNTPESIEIAVKAWKKYFMRPLEIIVVGDTPEADIGVKCVEYQNDESLSPHVNMVRCLCSVLEDRTDKSFIITHDDTIPTRPFDIQDIQLAIMHDWPELDEASDNYYIADLARTYKMLQHEGIEHPVNYCCHAPHVYDTRLFLNMVSLHSLDVQPIDFETLYYNLMVNEERVCYDNWHDNPYSVIIMPGDSRDDMRRMYEETLFLSFGGSVTEIWPYEYAFSLLD